MRRFNLCDLDGLKAVIFDMDGVLIDSQPIHFQVDMEVLVGCHVFVGLKEVEAYAGMANTDRWTAYKRGYGLTEDVPSLIKRHAGILMGIFEKSALTPIEGIPQLLAAIRGMGLKTAVASSSSMALIELVTEKLGIAAFFDALVTGEDVLRGKPAPDVFLKAAAALGVAPEDCIVVEDSANGVAAAKNAGMRVSGYHNPNSGEQDLSAADRVVDGF